MNKKAITKLGNNWPMLFGNGGLIDNFFHTPLDRYFHLDKIKHIPCVNVEETDSSYCLTVATPGLEKKDIKVDLEENILTISAEKKEEKKDGRYNRREYNYSNWRRSFTLPENCDKSKVTAEYANGELKICVPKNGEMKGKKAKSIAIS